MNKGGGARMKVIILGAGKIGYKLAELLSEEKLDIVVVDRDVEALKKAEENLDVMCIEGNGVSTHILLDAGIENTDILIAVTSNDEVNMLCCLMGKKLGAAQTIARIRDPEYVKEISLIKEDLKIDYVINPEQAAAEEIARLLSFPSVSSIENFANDLVRMISLKVLDDMSITGCKIKDIREKINFALLICLVVRGNDVFIPDGNFRIEEGDEIYIIGKPSNVYKFCTFIGKSPEKIRNIIVLGGGRITYYLAKLMTEMGIKVKIIEIDPKRCEQLSDELPNCLIINADGTDENLLLYENIREIDAFAAITGIDEENILLSLYAKKNGVKKIITKVSRSNYINLINDLGIDHIIDPKFIIANKILKYMRGANIKSLFRLIEGKVEIIEFVATGSEKFFEVPLKYLKSSQEILIATIVRKNEVIIPGGDDVIKSGDRVIVITKENNVASIDEIFLSTKGGMHLELRNGVKKFRDAINN